jgi:N-acetyl sugar amidotransferase
MKTSSEYRICTRCIMDTSDVEIVFDSEGVCNHCRHYDFLVRAMLPDDASRDKQLDQIVETVRRGGRGREYDCVIGVSGGVDSTYLAYLVKSMGLRPLAVHLDNGWNSTQAVTNIERTLTGLGIDLQTEVLDWEEFRDLQLAFLRASTPDSEIPTDHAINAALMRAALEHGVKYILLGSNISTEAIMPRTWSYGIRDWRYIRSVHDRFGSIPLRTFPHFSLMDLVLFKTVRRRREIHILNFVSYDKAAAMQTLEREVGWKPYGGKHHESVYTRFFQAYILPRKFGADKRRAHLSTLICGGQMTREQALQEIQQPICDPGLLRQDREFVIKKLGISEAEFERIMALPPRSFWEYPSYEQTFALKVLRQAYRLPRRLRARRTRQDNPPRVLSGLREPPSEAVPSQTALSAAEE